MAYIQFEDVLSSLFVVLNYARGFFLEAWLFPLVSVVDMSSMFAKYWQYDFGTHSSGVGADAALLIPMQANAG